MRVSSALRAAKVYVGASARLGTGVDLLLVCENDVYFDSVFGGISIKSSIPPGEVIAHGSAIERYRQLLFQSVRAVKDISIPSVWVQFINHRVLPPDARLARGR